MSSVNVSLKKFLGSASACVLSVYIIQIWWCLLPARTLERNRYSFGKLEEALELPNLISVQKDSFKRFLEEGLSEAFKDITPITDYSETLQLEMEFDPNDEDLKLIPKHTEEECKERDMTYSAPVFSKARFLNTATGEIKEQTVFMGDFPMMTENGTFIINGTERVVVSQLVRSPGVIFEPGERFRLRNLAKHQMVKGTIHPYRGEWLEFDIEQKPGKDPTVGCLLYTSPSPRDRQKSRMPSSA